MQKTENLKKQNFIRGHNIIVRHCVITTLCFSNPTFYPALNYTNENRTLNCVSLFLEFSNLTQFTVAMYQT